MFGTRRLAICIRGNRCLFNARMVRDKLIEHVMTDTSLTSYMKRRAGANWEDCRSELCLVVAEKTDVELKKIEPYFNFWCVRVVRNINDETRGRHAMSKYKQERFDIVEVEGAMLQVDDSAILTIVNKVMDNLHWYDRELFKAYIEEGTMRNLSKATGIPLRSIWTTVNKVRDHIRSKVRC